MLERPVRRRQPYLFRASSALFLVTSLGVAGASSHGAGVLFPEDAGVVDVRQAPDPEFLTR